MTVVTSTLLAELPHQTISLMTKMFCDPEWRLLVLPKPHLLSVIWLTECSMLVVNGPNARNGFIASKMLPQFCSWLPFRNMINCFLKMKQWTACKKLWHCLTPSATPGGSLKHLSSCSWTRSIASRKSSLSARWKITSRITKVCPFGICRLSANVIGGADYASACDYILNRFVSLNQAEQKQIYTHFTCATDTSQIRFVMAAVNGMLKFRLTKGC